MTEFGIDILDMTPIAQSMKEKMDKMNFIKMKIFYTSKATTKKMKRQATDW